MSDLSNLPEIKREVLKGGVVKLSSGDCTFVYQRPRAGALYVIISGHDNGQFGATTLDEVRAAIAREGKIDLFVDAREALAAVSVSDDWTQFFATNRENLSRVYVLVGSKVMNLTVAIAQHLSRTGNLIQIYSDPEIFESRLNNSR